MENLSGAFLRPKCCLIPGSGLVMVGHVVMKNVKRRMGKGFSEFGIQNLLVRLRVSFNMGHSDVLFEGAI